MGQVIKIAILFMSVLFFGCHPKTNQSRYAQERGQPEEAAESRSYQISEKCLALLAYGLLSDDDNDAPFGGACKDIASDSLVKFIQIQKHLFKHWQKTGKVDTNGRKFSWGYNGDFGLLRSLIWTRITVKDDSWKIWKLNAQFTEEYYGNDYSFIWRFYIFGFIYNEAMSSFKLDSLNRIASFNDYAAYLDSAFYYKSDLNSFGRVLRWCREVKRYAYELKKYSKDDSPGEDFLLKYYALRCENKEGTPSQPANTPTTSTAP
jgi:hypothetical protein